MRGFVTDGQVATRQIDVLLSNRLMPHLFRDGDLVFTTPDTVLGIIEVKSRIDSIRQLESALKPLADNIALVRASSTTPAIAGLFAFETHFAGHQPLCEILTLLAATSGGDPARIVDLLALGKDIFVLHREDPPTASGASPGNRRWYGYNLPEMAQGYFVSNVIHATATESAQQNLRAWFPAPPCDSLPPPTLDLGFGVVVYGHVKGYK